MKTETTTADRIADYLVWSAHDSGSFISNLKLQKLLYYVQAWHLAIFERPLFPEKFEAWVHGPVIPDIYRRFSDYQWRPIDLEVQRPQLTPGTVAFIEEVLDEYGPLDARRLEYLTHRETPWIEARGGLSQDEPCHAVISEETMRSCYRLRLTEAEIKEIIGDEPEPVADCPVPILQDV